MASVKRKRGADEAGAASGDGASNKAARVRTGPIHARQRMFAVLQSAIAYDGDSDAALPIPLLPPELVHIIAAYCGEAVGNRLLVILVRPDLWLDGHNSQFAFMDGEANAAGAISAPDEALAPEEGHTASALVSVSTFGVCAVDRETAPHSHASHPQFANFEYAFHPGHRTRTTSEGIGYPPVVLLRSGIGSDGDGAGRGKADRFHGRCWSCTPDRILSIADEQVMDSPDLRYTTHALTVSASAPFDASDHFTRRVWTRAALNAWHVAAVPVRRADLQFAVLHGESSTQPRAAASSSVAGASAGTTVPAGYHFAFVSAAYRPDVHPLPEPAARLWFYSAADHSINPSATAAAAPTSAVAASSNRSTPGDWQSFALPPFPAAFAAAVSSNRTITEIRALAALHSPVLYRPSAPARVFCVESRVAGAYRVFVLSESGKLIWCDVRIDAASGVVVSNEWSWSQSSRPGLRPGFAAAVLPRGFVLRNESTASSDGSAALHSDRVPLLIVAGDGAAQTGETACVLYDAASDRWRAFPSLKHARAHGALLVLHDADPKARLAASVYAVGGCAAAGSGASSLPIERYSSDGEWHPEHTSLPCGHAQSVCFENTLF